MKNLQWVDERVFDIGYGRDFIVRKIKVELYPDLLVDVYGAKYKLETVYKVPSELYPKTIDIPWEDANGINEKLILEYMYGHVNKLALLASERDDFIVEMYGKYGINHSFDKVTEAKLSAMAMAYDLEGGAINENSEESSY